MQLRDLGDQVNYPGSSNELQNGVQEGYDSDNKHIDFANIIMNRNDFQDDLHHLNAFQHPFDVGGFAEYEIDPYENAS